MINRSSVRQEIMKPGLKRGGKLKKKKRKPPLGTGERFKSLTSKLKGSKDPKALAAWIGRKKYGPKKFASLRKRRS